MAMTFVICATPVIAESSDNTYDEYVVRFKDGYSPYGGAVLMSVEDGAIEPVIEDWNVYTVTEDMLHSLDMSQIEYIEPNYKVVLLEDYPNDPKYVNGSQSYFSMTGMPQVWDMALVEPRYLASSVKVAVIDSGIDVNHPDLENTTVYAYDYSKKDAFGNVVVDQEDVAEEQLHGTSVAGIIAAGFNDGYGVTGMTRATIYSLKVFDSSGADYYNICRAIKDAVDVYGCDVINMSLGFPSETGEAIPDSEISLLNEVIGNAADKGTIVVAASGNYAQKDGTAMDLPDGCKKNPIVYPAYCDNVISVGSVQSSGAISSFSSYNDMVDVVAPGNSLYLPRGSYEESDPYYWRVSGTSVASPQVAAAAAIIKGVHPEITQSGMEELIEDFSIDLGEEGRDDYFGWGLLDIAAMAESCSPDIEVEALTPWKSAYTEGAEKVSVVYLAPKNDIPNGIAVRFAIYDENDRLVEITEPRELTFLNSKDEENEIFEGIVLEKVTFDGVEIPSGGYAKVFCMNWDKIVPAASVVDVAPQAD